jgi:glutathione S-transferase
MVPPFAQGLVRDLRVRWALEEAGLPYRITLIGRGEGSISLDAYRRIQPFGQVPAIEDGDFNLFESGAIVQYVAERSDALLPKDSRPRARTVQWMFTALNTMENPIQELAGLDLFYSHEAWSKERRPAVVERMQTIRPARRLSGAGISPARSAADIPMITVCCTSAHRVGAGQPVLAAFQRRCEARRISKGSADKMARSGLTDEVWSPETMAPRPPAIAVEAGRLACPAREAPEKRARVAVDTIDRALEAARCHASRSGRPAEAAVGRVHQRAPCRASRIRTHGWRSSTRSPGRVGLPS